MDLSNIQNAILDDNIDLIIAKELKTDSCLDVYSWIDKNIALLRSWVLMAITGNPFNDPYKTSNIIENVSDERLSLTFSAYVIADDRFPLPESQMSAKCNIRTRIYSEIGDYDIYDIVADQSKRICMLERLVIRLVSAMIDGNSCPEQIVSLYGPLISQYMTSLNNGDIRDRTDLEDNYAVFSKLQMRSAKIADIVMEEMYGE